MIAIYIRTSTREQNPENQLRDCLSINRYGEPEVFKEYQSAWKDKDRPEFEKIREKIKQGEVKHLIVWAWDRLYRNRERFNEFFKLCQVYGCAIHSFNQQYFEDFYKIPKPFDEIVSHLVLNLLAHNAEEESNLKSERVKLAVVKTKGKPTKSYKGNLWGRKPMPNRIRKEVLEKRKQGLSIREIADSIICYDKNRNEKYISKSLVHKIIKEASKGMS